MAGGKLSPFPRRRGRSCRNTLESLQEMTIGPTAQTENGFTPSHTSSIGGAGGKLRPPFLWASYWVCGVLGCPVTGRVSGHPWEPRSGPRTDGCQAYQRQARGASDPQGASSRLPARRLAVGILPVRFRSSLEGTGLPATAESACPHPASHLSPSAISGPPGPCRGPDRFLRFEPPTPSIHPPQRGDIEARSP